MTEAFYQELKQELEKRQLSDTQFIQLKQQLAKKHHIGKIPKNSDLILHNIRLQVKPMRSQSGVSVITSMSAPMACQHGACTYCPGGPGSFYGDVPMSYTGNEPASIRGKRNAWNAYLQTFNRLEQYIVNGHPVNKVEYIVNGGTFTSYPVHYQEKFIRDAFQAMNDFATEFFTPELNLEKFKNFFELPGDFTDKDRVQRVQDRTLALQREKSLEQVQLDNEKGKIRCVALCLETRPDYSRKEHIDLMLKLGTTRVELGVQHLKDKVLEVTNRCHTVQDASDSTKELKDAFLKVGYHMMPGQPESSKEEDIWMFKELFDNPAYRPDALKIYPCMVMPGTKLYDDYKAGKFTPLTTEGAVEILAEAKKYIPEYCRIMRVQRDIPTKVTEAGVDRTNLRQVLQEKGITCRCIRCREPKEKIPQEVVYKEQRYESNDGTDVFLSAEDTKQDLLLGFARLRIPANPWRKEITSKSAGIRELHVYGNTAAFSDKEAIQHRGIGTQLMQNAEKIAVEEYDKDKMLVISGVGARQYYKQKLKYVQDGVYVSKKLC